MLSQRVEDGAESPARIWKKYTFDSLDASAALELIVVNEPMIFPSDVTCRQPPKAYRPSIGSLLTAWSRQVVP